MRKKITGQDINKNKVELDVSKMRFRPSVYGVLIKNNKVLLSKQWEGYNFPGGEMKIDETIEESLRREFQEETGIKVEVKEIIDCKHNFWLEPFTRNNCNCILLYYLCDEIGGKMSSAGFDEYEKIYADSPEWVDIDKVGGLKFYDPTDNVRLIKKAEQILKQTS